MHKEDPPVEEREEESAVPYEEVSGYRMETESAACEVRAGDLSGQAGGAGRVLLGAGMGMQPTGGGRISVTQVRVRNREVTVRLHVRAPAETEYASQAVSYPSCAISCPAARIPEDAHVVFIDQHDCVLCEVRRGEGQEEGA